MLFERKRKVLDHVLKSFSSSTLFWHQGGSARRNADALFERMHAEVQSTTWRTSREFQQVSNLR